MGGSDYLQEIKGELQAGRYQHRKGMSILNAFGYSRRRKNSLAAINREMRRLGLKADPPIDDNMPLHSPYVCFSLATRVTRTAGQNRQSGNRFNDTLAIQRLHPEIVKVSGPLFRDEHYSAAIFEACKAVNACVKKKSGLRLADGRDLMVRAFKEDDPIIKLNRGRSQSDRDEREGFKFLFMGAMVGIRNPKAHETFALSDANRALEYLAFASLLMRRVDEGIVARRKKTQGHPS